MLSIVAVGILLACTSATQRIDLGASAVLTPDGTACVECSETPGVLSAATERNGVQISRWLHSHFEPFEGSIDDYKAAPLEEKHLEFSDLLDWPYGFEFNDSGVSLRYWEAECRVFDCYRPYMERLDESGGVIWRHQVPFLVVPVFPFVVDGHVFYIGHHGKPEHQLIVLEVASGKIVDERLVPPGLSSDNPASTYPVMTDEFLFIQPCHVEWPDNLSTGSVVVTPQDILAVRYAR